MPTVCWFLLLASLYIALAAMSIRAIRTRYYQPLIDRIRVLEEQVDEIILEDSRHYWNNQEPSPDSSQMVDSGETSSED